jgi:hypothetical protein
MLDLTKTEPYLMAKRAEKFLTDSMLWFDTFGNNPRLINQMLDLIRFDQLFNQGVDSNDSIIGFYSFASQVANPKKQQGTHYTLNDTGDLYRSMLIIVLRDSIEPVADTSKIQDQDWYNDDIIFWNKSSIDKIRDAYKRNAVSYERRVLFGDFGMSNVRLA